MEQNKREQFIIRRIGGTTYTVRVAFSKTAAETMSRRAPMYSLEPSSAGSIKNLP